MRSFLEYFKYLKVSYHSKKGKDFDNLLFFRIFKIFESVNSFKKGKDFHNVLFFRKFKIFECVLPFQKRKRFSQCALFCRLSLAPCRSHLSYAAGGQILFSKRKCCRRANPLKKKMLLKDKSCFQKENPP